jgi:hypothetical protein
VNGVRIALVLGCWWPAVGCSWLSSPQGQGTVSTITDVTVCILNHSQDPPIRIAQACGPQATTDVITKVIEAHKAAAVRERAGMQVQP